MNTKKIKEGDLVEISSSVVPKGLGLGIVIYFVEGCDTYRVYLFRYRKVVRGFRSENIKVISG
jgi:hypothetical protein